MRELPAEAVAVLDGLVTLAFALSDGLLGGRESFDLFGVLFLSFVVGVCFFLRVMAIYRGCRASVAGGRAR